MGPARTEVRVVEDAMPTPVLTHGEGPLQAKGQPGVPAWGTAAARLFRKGQEAKPTAKHPGPHRAHQQGTHGGAACRGTH